MAGHDQAVDQRLILGRELVVERSDIVVPLLFRARACDDRAHERRVQDPGHRELTGGDAFALGVAFDSRGNVLADPSSYKTSLPKVFVCGDMRRGQSLVVWAIREGRQAANAVDKFLMGSTLLPR